MRFHNLDLLEANSEELKLFLESNQYNDLIRIVGPSSSFQKLAPVRNKEIHPSTSDTVTIDYIRKQINDEDDLDDIEKEEVKILDLVYEELLNFRYERQYLK